MFRFSLAALFLFMLLAALGCAALAQGGELWRQAVVTLAVMLLLASTLAAAVCRGELRSAAAGFAVFGWGYLLVAFIPVLELRDDLLTEQGVSRLYAALYVAEPLQVQIVALSPQGNATPVNTDGTVRVWEASGQTFDINTVVTESPYQPPSYEDFAGISHALGAILIALLGAALARKLAVIPARRREATE
jgi:hypothetical protein